MMIPYVIERKSGTERSMDLSSRLLEDRIIMLSEDVNPQTASVIISELLFLESQDPSKDVMFYVNSPGGSCVDGLAIIDTMNTIKCDVSTICVGMAASMGALILSSGAKGKRLALPHSEIMIHQPLIGGGGLSGQCTDIMLHANNLQRTRNTLNEMLSRNTGKPIDVINADTERDNYMTAQEALNYGLIDKIVESAR